MNASQILRASALVAVASAMMGSATALASPGPSPATFIVSTAADEVDLDPGDGLCATASGECSLRAAVMEANALAGPDLITLPGGPANPLPSLSLAGAGEDASRTGDLDILDDLTISGDGMSRSGVEASQLGDRAVHVHRGVKLDLVGLSIVYADAGETQAGGGLFNEGSVSMLESSLQFNHALEGGGVANLGTMTMTRSIVGYNTASTGGGGVENWGSLTIDQSTVANNEVLNGPGGGIANFQELAVLNSTISQNRATFFAAALHNQSSAHAILNNSTVVFNQIVSDSPPGPSTGGLFDLDPGSGLSSITISNTIVALNAVGTTLPYSDCMGTITSSGFNLIGSTSGCSMVGDTSGDLYDVDPLLEVFPVLDPLGTWGFPPLAGSPAINAGNPAEVGSSTAACESLDQRGLPRPLGPVCDIGAYESEYGAVGTPSWTPTLSPTPTATSTPTATPSASPTATAAPTATPSASATVAPSPPPSGLFADDFETGDLSAWTLARTDGDDLRASTDAALQGTYGLEAIIDDNHVLFVEDDTPDGESAYRARFTFDPNGISIGLGKAFVVFQGRRSPGPVAFEVEIRLDRGQYQLRAVAPQAGGRSYATRWIAFADGPQEVEIAWWAATSLRDRNGGLELRIDGELVDKAADLRTYGRRVDQVRLGAVSGASAGTRGVCFFDAFASTGGDPIGSQP